MSQMTGGIASMTRTRVDSAAKHIMPAKIDSNLMKVYCGGEHTDLQTMHQKKLELMTEKDDLILNVSRKLACLDTRTFHAYPAAVSTLANCTETYKLILAVLHSQKSAQDFYDLIRVLQNPTRRLTSLHAFVTAQAARAGENKAVDEFMTRHPDADAFERIDDKALHRELATMPFYQLQVCVCFVFVSDAFAAVLVRPPDHMCAQGYSLGRAYASPISGDTVFSVLIGGCVTALNGHFAMHAGQLVQWYFDFEHVYFSNVHDNINVVGQRVGARRAVPDVIGPKRRRLEEPRRKSFVHPKPYVPDWDREVYADKMRIFGKCLNGAGPFEPVDIMIMTQSL